MMCPTKRRLKFFVMLLANSTNGTLELGFPVNSNIDGLKFFTCSVVEFSLSANDSAELYI